MEAHYSKRLADAGCTVSMSDLCARLPELLGNLHGNWSDEELMRHPRLASDFCDAVRNWDGCEILPDDLILGLLSYARKHTLLLR
jgi:hypothetical protein